MITVDIGIKKVFFDRPILINAAEKGTLKALSKAGAYVRTAARSILRRRKKTSLAGQPPSVHSDDPVRTLKYILFGYVASSRSVVVGPLRFNQRMNTAEAVGTVPRVLEKGGTVRIKQVQSSGGQWTSFGVNRRRNQGKPTRMQSVRYEARPFMGPALKKSLVKLPEFWNRAIVA